jgi:hypothetical protein
MTGNLIGEPTELFVKKEVEARQKLYGKGFNEGSSRSIEEINYLNNRNAWIKMASSVSISNEDLRVPLGLSPSSFGGNILAKKAILFNGMSSLDGELKQRQGISYNNSSYNDSVYGLGGNQFGIQPMPGINSIQVDTKNRGSIRTATVEITAFNRTQFEIIETLYLRLGFSMLLEWGWDRYIDWEDNNKVKNVGLTLTENGFFSNSNSDSMLESIKSFQSKYKGNYDGFFGRVVNFNWQFQPDGSYKISVKLTSLGDIVESMKINVSPTKDLKKEIESIPLNGRFKLLEEAKSAVVTNKATTKLGAVLYSKLSGESFFGKDSTNSDYFNMWWAIENSGKYKKIGKHNLDIRYCYYVRFGELLKIIQEEIIPNVNDSAVKLLKFDLDVEKTICSYYPNLISFDPKVCIINASDEIVLNQHNISGIELPDYLQKLEKFAKRIPGSTTNTATTYTITYAKVSPKRNSYYDVLPPPEVVTIPDALKPFDRFTNSYVDSSGNVQTLTNYQSIPTSTRNQATVENGDLLYGKLHNIYLNYDMIFNTLKNNVDKKGNLTLFKFLQNICDKINSSFANVIDLECMVKDNKTITFLDGKPVMGLSSRFKSFNVREGNETAEIEVFGFNPVGEGTGTFLKNISFNTKISPKLTSQLSIGATARGVAVGEDATGFSNWNRGLVDRFQQTIEDPKTTPPPTTTTTTTTTTDEEQNVIKWKGGTVLDGWLNSKNAKYTTKDKTLVIEFTLSGEERGDVVIQGTGAFINNKIEHDLKCTVDVDLETGEFLTDVTAPYKGKGKSNTIVKGTRILLKKGTISSLKELETKFKDATSRMSQRTNFAIFREVSNQIAERGYGANPPNFSITLEGNIFDPEAKINSLNTEQKSAKEKSLNEAKSKIAGQNYSSYLATMFGGNPSITNEQGSEAGIELGIIEPIESLYATLTDKTDFSESGISSYKIYLNSWSQGIYSGGEDNKTPSNQIGIIPVEFDMEMDGISGFKIYNKLKINQRFLPTNYADSLEFLIKGLNHKVDSSGWTSNVQTLSTSNLNAVPVKQNKAASSRRRTQPTNQQNNSTNKFPPDSFVGSPELQPIKDLIAKYESNGSYSIANQGSRGGYRISSTNVTTKTANQLLNELSTTYTDKEVTDVVFAMGRYQVIPKVLKQAVNGGVIKENDLFDTSNQEKVCDYLLLAKRKSQIGKYLRGENGGSQKDLERAIQGLGQEWASMPCVENSQGQKVGNVTAGTGKSGYYGGDGINPSVSKVDVGTAVQKMIESRIKYSKNQPSYIPPYVTV